MNMNTVSSAQRRKLYHWFKQPENVFAEIYLYEDSPKMLEFKLFTGFLFFAEIDKHINISVIRAEEAIYHTSLNLCFK